MLDTEMILLVMGLAMFAMAEVKVTADDVWLSADGAWLLSPAAVTRPTDPDAPPVMNTADNAVVIMSTDPAEIRAPV